MSRRTTLRSLVELAALVDASITGPSDREIRGLATLSRADDSQLSFLANPRYLKDLSSSRAGAVLVRAEHAHLVHHTALVVADPYLAFARLSQLFDWRMPVEPGVAADAVIANDAQVDVSAQVCAGAVVESGVTIGPRAYVGPRCVVGRGSSLGEDSRLEAGVVLYPQVRIGARVLVHSGAVLGADGFGFARSKGEWVKICQLGGVVIEDDVEIGAGVTIDRGALDDTIIGRGVKLDNQIQVAHNVSIGEHTAIAGCTAIAGSTKIGRYCTIAGMSGITGHLQIADHTHVTAMTLVSKSINEAGTYSSGTGLEPHQQWKRNVVRFRQLDELAQRVRKLEKALSADS